MTSCVGSSGNTDRAGFPLVGWVWKGVSDNRQLNGTCDVCRQRHVRFAHTIWHPSIGEIVAGRTCAKRLLGVSINDFPVVESSVTYAGHKVDLLNTGSVWTLRLDGHVLNLNYGTRNAAKMGALEALCNVSPKALSSLRETLQLR